MALNQYVLTATVTLPSGAFTLGGSDVIIDQAGAGGGFGTGSYAQSASHYGSGAGSVAGSTTWYRGQIIWADPAGALFTAIGSGNLQQITDGAGTVSHFGISN
jgi:hypothetical protein